MIPIVTWHRIADDAKSPLATAATEFERQIRELAEGGYRAIRMSEVPQALGSLDGKAVAITFDDGYASFAAEAWPVLRRFGFTATVFLVTACVGSRSDCFGASPSEPLLRWSDVARLAEEGCEIGAHTRSHPPLVELADDAARAEIENSRDDIERNAGVVAHSFAYPYGACDRRVASICAESFALAVTTHLGFAAAASDRHLLPRIDAFYLRGRAMRDLAAPSFRRELARRRILRRARRLWREDWE